MTVPADLDRIASEQDRSATPLLLDLLADPSTSEEDRDRVADALADLADPRSVGPLLAMAENAALDAAVREAALDVLADGGLSPEGEHLRRWWASGDEALQKQALIEADRTEADIVGPITDDPSHPLHAQAIWGTEYCFEEPEWQERKIRALGHPLAKVRRAATAALLWDEPVRAESPLRQAAGDPDPEVAVAAIEALAYYPARSTVEALDAIARARHDDRAAAAGRSLDSLRGRFEDALAAPPPVRARLRRWMEPVWPILGFADAAPAAADVPSGGGPEPKIAVPPPADLTRVYSDPDGPWAAKLAALYRYDWTTVALPDRPPLSRFFAAHPDPEVRDRACAALAAWQATDELLGLVHDPVSWVRKSAVYHLHAVPPSREVARLAWDLIARGEVANTRGREALRTYFAHADPEERTDALIELARTDRRETLRYEAVDLLDDVTPLLGLLADPPLVTWAVHVVILASCASAGIAAPPVAHLHDVDNLDVAEALAELELPHL